jgi:hypothetical protein
LVRLADRGGVERKARQLGQQHVVGRSVSPLTPLMRRLNAMVRLAASLNGSVAYYALRHYAFSHVNAQRNHCDPQ